MRGKADSNRLSGLVWRKCIAPLLASLAVVAALLVMFFGGGSSGTSPLEPTAGTPERELPRVQAEASEIRDAPAERVSEKAGDETSFLGRVVSRETGEAVLGALIWELRDDPATFAAADSEKSDSDGHFRMKSAQAAAPALFIHAEGFLPFLGPGAPLTETGREPQYLFELDPGASIEGRVVDEIGNPIAGATVRASAQGNRLGWPASEARYCPTPAGGARGETDADGRFTLSGLDGRQEYELRASAPFSTKPPRHLWPLVSGGEKAALVRLTRCGIVELAFLTKDGERIPADTVTVRMHYSQSGVTTARLPLASRDAGEARDHVIRRCFVRSEVEGVEAGSDRQMHVQVAALGYETVDLQVPIRLGGLVGKAIRLERDDRPARDVVLEARLRSGLGIDGSLVFMFYRLGSAAEDYAYIGIAFRDGVAEHPILLPVGRYKCAIGMGSGRGNYAYSPPHRQFFEIDVAHGEGPLRLPVAVEGDVLLLEVRSPDGRVARGFDLRVTGPATTASFWSERWDADWGGRSLPTGDVSPLLLPPGEFTISVNLPDVGAASGVARCDGSGKPRRLVLTLDPDEEVPLRDLAERRLEFAESMRKTGR